MTTTLAVGLGAEEELAAVLAGEVPALPAASLRQLAGALRYDAADPPGWAEDVWRHPGWQALATFVARHFPSAPHPELLVIRALQSVDAVRSDTMTTGALLAVMDRLKTRSHPVERPQTDLVKRLADHTRLAPPTTPRDHDRNPRQAVEELLTHLRIDPGPNTREAVLTAAGDAVSHVERVVRSRRVSRPAGDAWLTLVDTSQLAGNRNGTNGHRPANAFPASPVRPELTAIYFGVGYRHRVKTEVRPAYGMLWWLAKPDLTPPPPVVRRWQMSLQRMESKLDSGTANDEPAATVAVAV